MKKLPILLAVLFLAFSATHIFAQKKAKPKEVINIEFLIPRRNYKNKIEIPVNINSKEDSSVGQTSIRECGVPAGCKDFIYSTYTLTAKAFKVTKTKISVIFNIEVNDGCKTQKTFMVYQKRQSKIQLKCGVSLVAYYGVENKKGN